MKAYHVYTENSDYLMVVHSERPSWAKQLAMQVDPGYDYEDYTELRARRIPALDDKPFTAQALHDAGLLEGDEYYNHCNCTHCKRAPMRTVLNERR